MKELHPMNDLSLVSRVHIIDVRQMECTDEDCDTPTEPVVAVAMYVSHDGSAAYNGCCAGCLVKTMGRVEATPLLRELVYANFTEDYIARLREEIS